MLSFPIYTFSFCKKTQKNTDKLSAKWNCSIINLDTRHTSTLAASDDVLIIRPTTYFLIPAYKWMRKNHCALWLCILWQACNIYTALIFDTVHLHNQLNASELAWTLLGIELIIPVLTKSWFNLGLLTQ